MCIDKRPLGKTVRVALNRIKRDGYLSDGTDDDDEKAARVKLLVKPDDDVSIVLSMDGEQVRGAGGGYVYLPRMPGSSAWDGTTSAAQQAYAQTFNPNLVTGGPPAPFVHNDFWAATAQLDWNLGFATLTVIPAYRHTSIDSLGYKGESFAQTQYSNQSTFEARLGHAGELLKWVVGIYYFDEHDPGQVLADVGPGLIKANPHYDPTGRSYSAFGELTYSLTERLRLIGGGRFTTEKRTLTGEYLTSPDQKDDYLNVESFYGNQTFHSFTWKAGAEFDVAPQSMLYFTASTGFKAGGITQTVPPDNIYKPEQVTAFELGSRNRFLDNRLQVNLEAFNWKYKDQQFGHLTFDTLGNVNFLTGNAGSAEIYGLNADVLFRPTRQDTIHFAAEYDHSRYQSFTYEVPIFAYSPVATGCTNTAVVPGPFVPLAVLNCAGFQLPHDPEWSGQTSFTHSIDLWNGSAVDLNLAGRFSAGTWLAVDFIPAERAPAFAMLDASVSYRSPGRNYSVTAYGRNLNNGKQYTGGEEQTESPPLFSAVKSAPRTYGVQVHVDF
jgi:iron complex outermembrane recepter protein